MTSDLTAALTLDRAIRRRAAAPAIPIPAGLVVRHPQLWDVHYLNAVLLDAGSTPPPAAVVDLADRWLGDLGHRHVVFDDEAAGERAAAELGDWERRRTTYMAFRGDPDELRRDPRARAISETEMEALQIQSLQTEVPEAALRSGLTERLVRTQRVLRGATCARCFGAGDGDRGELQSMCTLFCDPDVGGRRVAMVEEVGTLPSHRGRGLARAVVGAAVTAAAAWGAALTVVPADADDWPQLMYAGLGFIPLGRQVTLTLRRGSGGDDR